MTESQWKDYELGQVGTFVGGATPSTARPEFWNGDIHWTTSRRLGSAYVISSGERFISRAGLQQSSTSLVPAGNLLIGTRVGVGKVAVNSIDMAISQDLTGVIVDQTQFDSLFLAFCLSQPQIQTEIGMRARGVTIKGVPREDLMSIHLRIPTKEEQSAVGSVLLSVQTAIACELRLLDTVKDLKHSAMRELFTIGPDGQTRTEPEIGLVPSEWETCAIADHFALSSGGTPSRANASFWLGGTIPWVKTGEVDYRVITETEEQITQKGLNNSAAKLLPAGTLLMAMYGQGITRGKVAMLGIEACCNQACAAFRPLDDIIDPEFLYYYLSHSYEAIRRYSHGGQQQNLNMDIVGAFRVAYPRSHLEQRDVVNILKAIDEKIDIHKKKRAVLEDLFRSLLDKLMTGEINVTDLDLSALQQATCEVSA